MSRDDPPGAGQCRAAIGLNDAPHPPSEKTPTWRIRFPHVRTRRGGVIDASESCMLVACGLFIAFQAAVGFLFGQAFAGHFSLAASLAGGAGLACAAGAFHLASRRGPAPTWIGWVSVATLIGVAADVASYYLYLAIPGNYYPWFLVAPFVACVAFVGLTGFRRSRIAPAT